MVQVRFLKSPTGRFFLGYSAGEVGLCPASLVEQAKKEGYIELIEQPASVRTAESHAPQQAQKAVKKVGRWGSGK